MAFGVDVNSKNAVITQEQFIAVNCFLRYGTMPKQMIIETWLKMLDPQGYGKISKESYIDFFEKLARGRLTMINTIVSSSFAQMLAGHLEQKGCLNADTKELIMKILAKKLFDKEIDIELFNQTLKSISELEVPDSKPIQDFNFLDGLISTVSDDTKAGKAVRRMQEVLAKKISQAL